MPTRWIAALRNHAHVLLIVPLVIIVMTWPTFAQIFNRDEFWLHSVHFDEWYKFWDAWHLERVFAGRADYYFTDTLFYPRGVSLAFHQISLPHALLMLVLHNIIPADDAYKLLFLLILCFNAFSAYLLIQHLVKDKWVALFGALVVGVATPFPHGSTLPDLITLGTIPLTMYFLHRSIAENRWRLAALAGTFAGLTAFIGMYIFLINLITIGIYNCFLTYQFWRTRAFWRALMVFFVVCTMFGSLRVYPMVAEQTLIAERIQAKSEDARSNDFLGFFVRTRNPFTGGLLHTLFQVPTESRFNSAYLGYINLLFIASAFLFTRRRRRLTPWMTILLFFAVMRLGGYLTLNGTEYPDIALPDSFLSDGFPIPFRYFLIQEFYQIGTVLPLAVLSSFGLATLLRSKRPRIRIVLALVSAFILAIEFYAPRDGDTLEQHKTAFVKWLGQNPENTIQLIHLPRKRTEYYLYLQSITDHPHVYGKTNNVPTGAEDFIQSNLLLRGWREGRSIHCLRHNEQEYVTALDSLLARGSAYIVVHNWRYGAQFIIHSFRGIPTAYDNGYVSVYRLDHMRLSCENMPTINSLAPPPPANLSLLARTSWAMPGKRSSILSFHPTERIDTNLFTYFASLFSDWKSLLHVYVADDGKLVIQNEGELYENVDAFASDNQIVHLVYDATNGVPRLPENIEFRDEFNLCRRETYEDDSVIELYFNPRFSCALLTSDSSLHVEYDNGAQIENMLYEVDQDALDLQILWRNLPDKTHSLSVQLFDGAGNKVLGQDSVIGSRSITHHIVDLSALPPGDYVVKLIFYRYSTGESVPGAVSGSGARFDRELEIATIRKT